MKKLSIQKMLAMAAMAACAAVSTSVTHAQAVETQTLQPTESGMLIVDVGTDHLMPEPQLTESADVILVELYVQDGLQLTESANVIPVALHVQDGLQLKTDDLFGPTFAHVKKHFSGLALTANSAPLPS